MKKIFLGSLGCLALAMAVYAGLWTFLCEKAGIPSWIGFAGCTSYFASGKSRLQGIKTAVCANISGLAWGMISIVLGNIWNRSYGTIILCAFISYMIIIQAKIKILSFIPGAYIGCFTTFGAAGNWKVVLPVMIFGVLLGYLTDISGEKLYQCVKVD